MCVLCACCVIQCKHTNTSQACVRCVIQCKHNNTSQACVRYVGASAEMLLAVLESRGYLHLCSTNPGVSQRLLHQATHVLRATGQLHG